MSYAHDMYHDDGGSYDYDTFGDVPDHLSHLCEDDHVFAPSRDPKVWVNGRGQHLALTSMTDLHLARALSVTVDKDGLTHPRAIAILQELARRAVPTKRKRRRT
jgi:hypothetical protein